MAVLDRITCGEKEIFSIDADPSSSGFLASIGSIAMFNDNGVGKLFVKTGDGNNDWKQVYVGNINDLRENIEDIVANLIKDTASIKWTYDDNNNELRANVDPSGVSHNSLANVQAAGSGVTHGHITDQEQTIAGKKIFSNEVVINGNLTVYGSTTSIEATNLEIKDRVITLNKGGDYDSAIGTGIEIDTGNSIKVQAIKFEEEYVELQSISSSSPGLRLYINAGTTVTMEGSNSFVYGYNGVYPIEKTIPYFDRINGLGEFRNSPLYVSSDGTRIGLGVSTPKGIFHRNYLYESKIEGTTTDATPVVGYSVTVPNNTIITIEARVNGRQTAGTSGSTNFARSYVRTALVKNINGTVTLVKLQSDFTAEDEATGDVTIDVSGNTVRVMLIGGASRTIKWYGHAFVLETPAT